MATTTRRRHARGLSARFGHPDGYSGDLREVEDHFIDFSRGALTTGLASRPDDRTVRVLVGKKGVGKTIYLRRFQAAASNEESVFAASRESNPPATEDVIRVRQDLDARIVTETWSLIWRRAIQRSVVTYLLSEQRLRDKLDPDVEAHLRNDSRGWCRPHARPAWSTPR